MMGTKILSMSLQRPVVMMCLLAVGLLGGLPAAVTNAKTSEMYVYPKGGQDQAQQDRDNYDCHNWAVQQTGFDPTKPLTTGTQTQSSQGGQVVGGAAAKGAAVGAIGGAIGGDAGKGAAIGAGVGAAGGGIKKRRAKKEQEAQQQAVKQTYQNDLQSYQRAKATCLEGRGYSVSY